MLHPLVSTPVAAYTTTGESNMSDRVTLLNLDLHYVAMDDFRAYFSKEFCRTDTFRPSIPEIK
jgi:hypothetical protein